MSWFIYDGIPDYDSDLKKVTQIKFSNKSRHGQVSAQIALLKNGTWDIWYHGMPTLADRRM